jgi:hypothetical protein
MAGQSPCIGHTRVTKENFNATILHIRGGGGWTCFNVPGLGVHRAAPGQEFPPTGPTAQLLYFFNTIDPQSDEPDFSGTETLLRDDIYNGQPCPTEPSGEYLFLGDLGGGAAYWACHRR